MLITNVMEVEHALLSSQADYLVEKMAQVSDICELRGLLNAFVDSFESHAALEEELLFRQLESYLGVQGTVLSLRDNMGHDELCKALHHVLSLDDLEQTKGLVVKIVKRAQGHFRAEEKELFPMAEREMKFNHLASLGDEWMARRRNHNI